MTMYSGDDYYGDDVTSPLVLPVSPMRTAKRLTDAQAEVYERLASDGALTTGFLSYEQFRARDNADNGARRTLRRMIALGLFVALRMTDSAGNCYYGPGPDLLNAYQSWLGSR